jgi:hypothetical protein
VSPFEKLAEQRILDAIAAGAFDDLPDRGQPLNLDDDGLVAPELRMAYRILKNAGYVPEEVRLRKEISEIEALLQTLDGNERNRAARRLDLLLMRLESRTGAAQCAVREAQYREKAFRRMGAGPRPSRENDRGLPPPQAAG